MKFSKIEDIQRFKGVKVLANASLTPLNESPSIKQDAVVPFLEREYNGFYEMNYSVIVEEYGWGTLMYQVQEVINYINNVQSKRDIDISELYARRYVDNEGLLFSGEFYATSGPISATKTHVIINVNAIGTIRYNIEGEDKPFIIKTQPNLLEYSACVIQNTTHKPIIVPFYVYGGTIPFRYKIYNDYSKLDPETLDAKGEKVYNMALGTRLYKEGTIYYGEGSDRLDEIPIIAPGEAIVYEVRKGVGTGYLEFRIDKVGGTIRNYMQGIKGSDEGW